MAPQAAAGARVLPPGAPRRGWGLAHGGLAHGGPSRRALPWKSPIKRSLNTSDRERLYHCHFPALAWSAVASPWQSWPQLQGKLPAFTISRHATSACFYFVFYFCCQ